MISATSITYCQNVSQDPGAIARPSRRYLRRVRQPSMQFEAATRILVFSDDGKDLDDELAKVRRFRSASGVFGAFP